MHYNLSGFLVPLDFSLTATSAAVPSSIPTPVCATVEVTRTSTPGANVIVGGSFEGELSPNWATERVTTRKNVGDLAQSPPYVLASEIDERLPSGYMYYRLGQTKGNYTLSFYIRLVSSTLPDTARYELQVTQGFNQLMWQEIEPKGLEKGWTKFEIKDVAINPSDESALNDLKFSFYSITNPEFHGYGAVEFWLDTIELYEQIKEVVALTVVCS